MAEMKKRKFWLVLLGVFLTGVLPAMAADHHLPLPVSEGNIWVLEAEAAVSVATVWTGTTHAGIDCVTRAPAPVDDTGWIQWEGLELIDGNYNMYVSWTRPGSGWLLGSKVWAGPDAANLREVVPSFNTVGLTSYAWEWDTVGFTNEVADNIPLLATDTVIKIMVKPAAYAVELFIDAVMLTLPSPHYELEPYYIGGQGLHLEAELATSMSSFYPTTFEGIAAAARKPAPVDELGWFQWEGLNLAGGDYRMYVSWTRNGSGWLLGSKVWAGPDAANLREVVPSFNTVGLTSYAWDWDTVGLTNEVIDIIPLLATDTVIKIMVKPDLEKQELYIDDFLLIENSTSPVPGDPCDSPPLPGPEWGRGHDIIMKEGLQIQAQVFPGPTGSFDLNLWAQSNFTTACIQASYDPNIMGDAPGVPWSHWDGFDALQRAYGNALPYYSNLISQQYADEQNLNQSLERLNAASYLSHWRELYPEVLGYTNQGGTVPTAANWNLYFELAEPDMLMQSIYPYGSCLGDWSCYYYRLELYREEAMLGNPDTNDSIRSIPHGSFLETYTYDTGHKMSESELRLNEFACWGFGCKFVSAFVYQKAYSDWVYDALFFTGIGDSSPTAQFYYMAETNRQSKNLGETLVRLASTKTFMIANQYALPSNVPAWSPSDPCTDPYITTITATNLSSYNSGNPSDVLIGYFKPLHESFDGPAYSNQDYFMIVNGLSAGDALAADTQQRIDITFDFAASGITQLQRVSRDTGLVEDVPLISLGGSSYKLELTLDGGTGDLFKFDVGAPFINGPYACGDVGTEYLLADISGPEGAPDCQVDWFDFAALADQWHMDMSMKQYTLTPVERGSTSSLGGDTGFIVGALVDSNPVNIWSYWEKYDIPVYPGERIIDDRGVVVDVNTSNSIYPPSTPGINIKRSGHDSWVVGPPRTVTSDWPVTDSYVTNRAWANDGTGLGLVQSDLTPWFDSARYGGPESQGRLLTLRYEASGGAARGCYIGNDVDPQGGCTITITTEPDLGDTMSADLSGSAGVPDDTVDLYDLEVFTTYWLGLSHP